MFYYFYFLNLENFLWIFSENYKITKLQNMSSTKSRVRELFNNYVVSTLLERKEIDEISSRLRKAGITSVCGYIYLMDVIHMINVFGF